MQQQAEELSEQGGFPCSGAGALMCAPPHATLLGGQCRYPTLQRVYHQH